MNRACLPQTELVLLDASLLWAHDPVDLKKWQHAWNLNWKGNKWETNSLLVCERRSLRLCKYHYLSKQINSIDGAGSNSTRVVLHSRLWAIDSDQNSWLSSEWNVNKLYENFVGYISSTFLTCCLLDLPLVIFSAEGRLFNKSWRWGSKLNPVWVNGV